MVDFQTASSVYIEMLSVSSSVVNAVSINAVEKFEHLLSTYLSIYRVRKQRAKKG